ncbi:MAG: S8 family serine peptidase, partial [Lachnospiraceae bacterium]|nr:S8 family serine peptidase [Lachnospiraceae bacterium]
MAYIHVEDVKSAVIASADPGTDLPAAWPIYTEIPTAAAERAGQEGSDTWDSCGMEAQTGDADAAAGSGSEPAAANAAADAEEAAEAGGQDEPELLGYTPFYGDPYLKKSNANYQWHHEMLDSNAAWKAGYTGKGIRVAILDTGVMPGHTEFKNTANNKIIGKAYYQVTGQNKGMVKADTLNDKNGNGTHLAGLVAAVAGNGSLGCGVAPDAQLLVANIHDPNLEYATTESLYYALQFVRKDWKPDIVVIGTNFYGYSKLVEEQMTLLYEDGIAVFCAAGDDGSNQTVYPAGCKRAISVGAVGMNNKPTETSNNNTQIRYSGPGYEVVSSFKTSSTASEKITGTAQACGCVA